MAAFPSLEPKQEGPQRQLYYCTSISGMFLVVQGRVTVLPCRFLRKNRLNASKFPTMYFPERIWIFWVGLGLALIIVKIIDEAVSVDVELQLSRH